MSLARRRPEYSSVAAARDLDIRADILRIAEMEATIRLIASVGPVGEGDIAGRFEMSMIEAGRLLDSMVADGKISLAARKMPRWLDKQQFEPKKLTAIEKFNSRQAVLQVEAQFSSAHWTFAQALGWGIHQVPAAIASITDRTRPTFAAYEPLYDQRREELRKACENGIILAYRYGEREPIAKHEWAKQVWWNLDLFEGSVLFVRDEILKFWPPGFIGPMLPEAAEKSEDLQPAHGTLTCATEYCAPARRRNTADDLESPSLEEQTRLKLKAIVAFYQMGGRSKGKFCNVSGPRNVKAEVEFAYRIMLEVRPDLKLKHRDVVKKKLAERSSRAVAYENNGVRPLDNFPKLSPQPRKLEKGFSGPNIKKLVLALEGNRHPWLIEGDAFKILLNSPGVDPPDIDNELCE